MNSQRQADSLECVPATTPTGDAAAASGPSSRWGRYGRRALALLPWLLLVASLAAYGVIQVRCFTPAYLEGDPDGYLILAKRMATGQPVGVIDNDPFLYQTHVWVENQNGEVLPKFAPGYPALMAIAYRLGGDEAMFVVSPLMGGLALIGIFLLVRFWTASSLAGGIAVIPLALGSMYNFYAGYLLTHLTSVCCVVWGMLGLWRWYRDSSVGWALLGGLVLGYASTVRHSNATLAMVVAVALLARLVKAARARTWPAGSLWVLASAYAVFPVLLGLYNLRWSGHFFSSGYNLSEEQTAFQWKYFLLHSTYLNNGLSYDILYMFLPLGLLGILLAGPVPERLMRAAWLLPPYFIYATYYFACESQAYYRFLLETLPVIVGAAYMLLQRLTPRRSTQHLAMAFVAALIVANNFGFVRGAWRGGMYGSPRPLAEIGRVLDATVKPDAVLFLSGRAKFAVGTHRDYRAYNLESFSTGYARNAFAPYQYRPYHPSVMQQESRRARFEKYYQEHNDGQLRDLKRELVASYLDTPRQVVYLLPSQDAKRERQDLGAGFELTTLKEWNAEWWGTWGIYVAARSNPPPAQAAAQAP